MQETEAKILEVDREKMVEKLLSIGAIKIFEGELDSLMFDDENRMLSITNRTLRLRKFPEKNVLTYKSMKKSTGAKVAEEKEIDVDDFGAMKKILKSIGFIKKARYKKRRISYSLQGYRIEFDKPLDDVDYVPEYMEIEGSSFKSILELTERLGIDKKKVIDWDFGRVKKYYKTKQQ